LEGAYEQFLENGGEIDFDASFAHHIYHAPFPGMTFQAHRTLLGRMHPVDKATAMASFKAKVLPGLGIARQIGSAYGASNFVCLLGLMSSMPPDKLGDRLSLFAYGSGCQGEFYTGSLGLEAHSLVQALAIDGHLSERSAVSTTDYEESEHERATLIELADYNLDLSSRKAYLEQYDGRHLLVLPQVRNFQREYRWS
jgi:hydroxymethylglutaryl-CoA synthase